MNTFLCWLYNLGAKSRPTTYDPATAEAALAQSRADLAKAKQATAASRVTVGRLDAQVEDFIRSTQEGN